MATLRELLGEAYKEGMTFDEIESVLASKKLADLSTGEYVSKGKAQDYEKRMKEAEKKLAEKLTDDEKEQAERAKREEYYKALERENAKHKYTSKLSKTIKDETVLAELAELYANGDYEAALDKQNEYLAKEHSEIEKRVKQELMKQNPSPHAESTNGGTMTKEKIMAIKDPVQRQAEIAKNITLFTN